MFGIFRKLRFRVPSFLKRLARRHQAVAPNASVETVVGMVDIMNTILELLPKQDLLRCALVCRNWDAIVRDIVWRGRVESGVGIRPILSLMEEYYEEHRKSRFKVTLSTTSWDRFNRSGYAGRIRVLDLDLRNLNCTTRFLGAMLDSIQSPMRLPKLQHLHVTVSQVPVELQIAMAFFSNNVTHFVADIDRGYPWTSGHRHNVNMDSLIPVFRNPLNPQLATQSELFPLDGFLAAVAERMPHIQTLGLNMRDSDGMVTAFSSFITMLCALEGLISLSLPPYALGISLVAALSTHQNIRYITAIQREPARRATVDWDNSDAIIAQPVTGPLDGPSARLEKLAVTVPICTFTPFFTEQFNPQNLTSLRLIIQGEVAVSDLVKNACSMIADRCWSLEELTVSLTQPEDSPWQIGYDVLRSLCGCERLVHLDVTSSFNIKIDNEEFGQLVSHWPRLKHLALDGADAVPVSPVEQASLSLGTVMELLRKHCPHLVELVLYVSMALPFGWFRDGSPAVTPPSQIATYLSLVLPQEATLYCYATAPCIFPGSQILEWETRRRI
ncbi:hypothetical protein PHLCEN_2v7963 [Hermanssonia centrifuga]|uniref:F-box domain-containing protein n=1 Tax=Hermanssonia centrifuga TaxID=98765 RepID=A0A2R6NVK1_9APHY|nr:hypothetical protein PHLCEN_2v7963 [Hermanssonia centrifuga]